MLKAPRLSIEALFLYICWFNYYNHLMNTELTNEVAPVKKNFDFVDTFRCISMIGLVFEYSTVLRGDKIFGHWR